MERIEFNNTGYDPQIDYIKGFCILFVIWTHCFYREELSFILFPYWGDTAVPIFLIIQSFHYYKKGVDFRIPSFLKLWKRIILPFIIMVALMFITQYFIYYDVTDGLFSPSLYWDRRGPGSYYIVVYLELAFIIPVFAPLLKKLSDKWLFVIFIFLSQIIEFITCITHCPDNIYRITFFRYTFLILLGYLLATKGLKLNKYTICMGIISIIFIYLFCYTNTNLEPFFCTSLVIWPLCHWVCYIYIAYLFLPFLKYTFYKLTTFNAFLTYIEDIGKYSYEIFLFQIFYYATICIYVKRVLSVIDNHLTQRLLYIIISTFICILPLAYKKRNDRYNKYRK